MKQSIVFWTDRICCWVSFMLAMAVPAVLAVIVYCAATAEKRDRAAWNEGYYGVDHATAAAMAERGIGKSAEDILNWKPWRRPSHVKR